jgi:hypothetical protein
MIKKYQQFILEKKLYIFTRSFRLNSLIDAGIYPKEMVDVWMKENGYDAFATGIFVSEKVLKSKSEFIIKQKEKDIKNKKTFNITAKGYSGKIMSGSQIDTGGDTVFLYIFDKNSNPQKRARQNHGFRYEGQVIRGNNLKKEQGSGLGYTDKWDAEGTLDKSYIDEKSSVDCKKIEIGTNVSRQEVVWEDIRGHFSSNMKWSIKCMANGTDVELGDFLRISGYQRKQMVKKGYRIENCGITKRDGGVDKFMLCVGFHDNSAEKKVLEEYFIPISIDEWQKLLPDIEANIKEFGDMYNELGQHKVKSGKKTEETESAWVEYRKKYRTLFEESIIKVRFKRDSKGQLRLQAAISNSNFMKYVLKNRHIRIS